MKLWTIKLKRIVGCNGPFLVDNILVNIYSKNSSSENVYWSSSRLNSKAIIKNINNKSLKQNIGIKVKKKLEQIKYLHGIKMLDILNLFQFRGLNNSILMKMRFFKWLNETHHT